MKTFLFALFSFILSSQPSFAGQSADKTPGGVVAHWFGAIQSLDMVQYNNLLKEAKEAKNDDEKLEQLDKKASRLLKSLLSLVIEPEEAFEDANLNTLILRTRSAIDNGRKPTVRTQDSDEVQDGKVSASRDIVFEDGSYYTLRMTCSKIVSVPGDSQIVGSACVIWFVDADNF